MRRMMHLGAGVMLALCLLGAHAGGAGAGLFCWLCLGAALSKPHDYPYPRKSRRHGARLFFAWTAALCLLSVLFWLEKALLPAAMPMEHGLFCVGAVGFSACLGGAALDAERAHPWELVFAFFLLLVSLLFYFL